MSSPALDQIEQTLEPIVAEEGLELLDVSWVTEHGRKILRVFLDKEGGVSLGDCSKVSRAIEDILEVKGFIPARYDLEVSSAGVEKPLKKEAHFAKVIGKMVKVQTQVPLDDRRNFKGILKEVQDQKLTLEIDGKLFVVPISQVLKANLVFEFK